MYLITGAGSVLGAFLDPRKIQVILFSPDKTYKFHMPSTESNYLD